MSAASNGAEATVAAAATPSSTSDSSSSVAPSSTSTKSAAARKKANRRAKQKQTNSVITSLLTQCNSLTHETIFESKGAENGGGWFSAFSTYKRVYRLHYLASDSITDDLHEWMYLLTKINMSRMYQRTKGWGWKEKEKRDELKHKDARYFVIMKVEESENEGAQKQHSNGDAESSAAAASSSTVAASSTPAAAASASSSSPAPPTASSPSSPTATNGSPIGFCHIRFTTGDVDGAPILYVYELQLEQEEQRHGLGKFLMSLVELFAWRCQLLRTVLTVFRSNTSAYSFYTKTLKYTMDMSDPSLFEREDGRQDVEEEYVILAKENRKVKTIQEIVLPIAGGMNMTPSTSTSSTTTVPTTKTTSDAMQ